MFLRPFSEIVSLVLGIFFSLGTAASNLVKLVAKI